jgi:hypothetical protein
MPQALRRFIWVFVFGWLLPWAAQAAQYQGGELTYEALGNNVYRVKLRLFRDCGGPPFNPTETLSCRVGANQAACTSTDARNFTAQLSPVGTPTSGAPYCPLYPLPNVNQCSPNAPVNYEQAYYQADVTLPPAPEWTLSFEACCRPAQSGLLGADSQPLRLQATINNLLTLAGGAQQIIQNTSSQYQPQDPAVSFACLNQRYSLTFSTFEPDGDSVVYSLDTPQYGCNQPAPYQTFAPGGVLTLPNEPNGQPCQATLPTNAPTAYSAEFPLPSFTLSGNCPGRTATPNFVFNKQLGSFSFTPVLYYPLSVPANRTRNQYSVTGKVTEYRLIRGQYYQVGTIYRNMLVTVIDCLPLINQNPVFSPLVRVAGLSQPQPFSDTLRIAPGQSASVTVNVTDPDPGQTVTVAARSARAVPAGAFQAVSVLPGEVTLTFSPPLGLADGYYPIILEANDNGCPSRSSSQAVFFFRVSSSPLSAAAGAQPLLTTASPNPFSSAVTFRISGPLPTGSALEITNVLGQRVERLPLRTGGAEASATWRPAPTVPAGLYLVRLPATGQVLRVQRQQ